MELGFAYQRRGRLTEALRQFDAAVSNRPSASDVHVWRGLTLEAAGQPELARGAFRTAWENEAVNPVKAYYALSRRGALRDVDRERAMVSLRNAYQRLITGRPPPARAAFPVWGIVSDDRRGIPAVASAGLTRTVTLLTAGRFDEAVVALRRRTTREGMESPLARFEQGQIHEAEGNVIQARRDYEAALPGALTGRALLYALIARHSQVAGDAIAAIDAFLHAIALAPNDPLKHRDLASVYMAEGRTEDAFAELVAALLIDPGDPSTLAAIGQLHLSADRDADAVVSFRRALELRPDRFETRYGLATALTRLGRGEEAAQELALFERARLQMEAKTRKERAAGAR
jgi:tetratricopeptide (TPR) repeat protein